jgi:hypothetical protein
MDIRSLVKFLHEVDIEGRDTNLVFTANKFKDKLLSESRIFYAASINITLNNIKKYAGRQYLAFSEIRSILGHGQDTVTDIYIDLDLERIDDAMRKVLDEIKQKTITLNSDNCASGHSLYTNEI